MKTVEDRAERAYVLLRELVRVDNTNPPGNEAAATAVLRRFLEGEGLGCVSAEKDPGRENLVCRVDAGTPGLLLAAHLDTVPADPEAWSHPPFAGEEGDGYLYGRGTLDMKHMAAMSAVVAAEGGRRKLKKDLAFAAVADEERGCGAGSAFLVTKHSDLLRAECCLTEGGGFTQFAGGVRFYPIGVAEKGKLTVRLSFQGKGGHGSIPSADSAVFRAAAAIGKLRGQRFPLHHTPPARAFFERLGRASGLAGIGFSALAAPAFAPMLLSLLGPRAEALRPMLSHTANPTRFGGAAASNIAPETVTVDLDMRLLPGYRPEDALRELWDLIGGKVEHEILDARPGLCSGWDTEIFRVLESAVRKHDPDGTPVPYLMPFFTDGGFIRRLGIPCYGFAPLVLSPRDAVELRTRIHGSDERVSKSAFLKGYALLESAVFSYLT